MTQDLTTAELAFVQKRIDQVLEDREAISFYGLQYRLGEVGRSRTDARELRRALAETANNRRPRRGQVSHGPWEPVRDLYVSSDLNQAQASRKAEELLESAATLASLNWSSAAKLLAQELGSRVTITAMEDHRSNPRHVVGETTLDATSCVLTVEGAAKDPVSLWLSHDPEWIYPDDPRLWSFLIDAVEKNQGAIVLARKIATPTFPLFKALGLKGLQYYASLVQRHELSAAEGCAQRIGWPYHKALDELPSHAVVDRVCDILDASNDQEWSPEARDAVAKAVQMQREDPHMFERAWLSEWARNSPAALPHVWLQTVERWADWSEYNKPQRRLAAEKPWATTPSPPLKQEAPAALERGESGEQNETAPTGPDNLAGQNRGFGRETKIIPLGVRIR